jgi:hypothetical protein
MRNPKFNPRAGASKPVAGKANYVKFSNKLSDSLEDISVQLRQHTQMIDSIQEVAIELTGAIGSLHLITVKYARQANQFLDILVPLIRNLPIIPKNARDMVVNLEKWTQKIIDNEARTAGTINSVRSGLQTGDVNKLKAHATELQTVSKTLTALLPNK